MLRRATAALLAAAVMAASSEITALASDNQSDLEHVDGSGLVILFGDSDQVEPMLKGQRQAWESAFSVAMLDREDFGYPWLDSATNSLHVAPRSDRGRELAQSALVTIDSSITVEYDSAVASVAELDRLSDGLTRLNAEGVPQADLIWRTEPDFRNNRIVVTVAQAAPGLLAELARRFGTTNLAVRVESSPVVAGPAGRNDDFPPFYGGARISTNIFPTCTTGFGWTAGSNKSMLFAGHCALAGGVVAYPSFANVGTVSATSEENWSKTSGTTFFTGQSVYRGDLALIRYTSLLATGRAYTGAVSSGTNSDVSDYGWSALGDPVCVNGVADGENCGGVYKLGVNIHYTTQGPAVDGDNVWLRNAVEVIPSEWNQCPINGDSGAPAYNRKADGTLLAKGILSGFWSGPLGCRFYYTDIMEAYSGLPGTVQT